MLNDEDLKEEWDKHVKEESKLDKELLADCEAGRAIIGNSNFQFKYSSKGDDQFQMD